MKPKSATALLAVSILVGDDIALKHSDSLVPREHVHPEMHAETVADTAAYPTASGGQVMFDNESFSPDRPWECWWPANESQMAAAQGMLRLGE